MGLYDKQSPPEVSRGLLSTMEKLKRSMFMTEKLIGRLALREAVWDSRLCQTTHILPLIYVAGSILHAFAMHILT